jgi:membrane protein DedA with SNARE-associated domain
MQFQQIALLLSGYTYVFLFPAAVIEGPIVTVLAGFLSSLGYLSFWVAYGVILLGDLVGDSILYGLGYYGRKKLVDRWGRLLRITNGRIETLEHHFEKHAGKTLTIGKLSHGIGAVVLLTAGMAKVPFSRFIWYNLIATLPKSLILLLIGFYFGSAYTKINTYLNYAAVGTFIIALLCTAIYFGMRNVSKKYEKNELE